MNLMVCCVTSAAGSAEAARSTRQNHMLRCTSFQEFQKRRGLESIDSRFFGNFGSFAVHVSQLQIHC
jgi:hypothetical protein